jgi:hypothetical protein
MGFIFYPLIRYHLVKLRIEAPAKIAANRADQFLLA